MNKSYDEELKRYYVEMRDKIKQEHTEYLHNHPEIRDLLNDFVSNCLLEKPKDIYEHAQKYFQYFNLQREVEKQVPLVVCGCSGAGKGTMVAKLMEHYAELFKFSVSYTTRQPRAGEVHGQHYFFISREEFEKEREEGNFIEACEVHGNYYGTHTKQVQSIINRGQVPLLDVDIQGAQKVKEAYPDSTFLWIDVQGGQEELRKRLQGRGTETEESLEKRLANAETELATVQGLSYFQRVVNQEREQCYSDILALLKTQYKALQ